MTTGVEEPGRLKVFISYSRSAQELLAALRLAGFEPYLDKHDIAAGEARLGRLIERMLHKLTIVRATLRHRLFVTFGEFQPWAYALLTKMFHAS